LTIRVDSQLYDITSHIATIVIFESDAYARFGHQVEESYRSYYRILCEIEFAMGI
jgi:hypothetical protein